MSAHVSLNLLNELKKRDKMRAFSKEFNKFNNTNARMLDSIYHMTFRLLLNLISGVKHIILSLCTQRCYGRHNVSRKFKIGYTPLNIDKTWPRLLWG